MSPENGMARVLYQTRFQLNRPREVTPEEMEEAKVQRALQEKEKEK